ncbi:hypothetical protein [Streptomyces sp. NPDC020141]|uniref:hypothetical protein n=1 Tax=Streptomyces sp. NPDC020141 TaxID=3365065 RepID=UPI0037917A1A
MFPIYKSRDTCNIRVYADADDVRSGTWHFTVTEGTAIIEEFERSGDAAKQALLRYRALDAISFSRHYFGCSSAR